MKIAFLNIYSGINARGAEAFTHELGNRLLKDHLVVFYQSGDKAKNQKIQVIKINTFIRQPQSQFSTNLIYKILKYLFLDFSSLSALFFTLISLKSIMKNHYDIIIPMNGFWQLLIIKIMQPIGKYKILIAGHSGPGWDEKWNLYLKPDIFIALTKPSFDWAKKICSWTRIELIPLAVDIERMNEIKEIKLPVSKPIILCPAALVPYKRIHLAIEAVSKIPNLSLIILGKGILKSELYNLGIKLLGKRFYLNNVSYDQMPTYYKCADVVTLPSLEQENSPMVFLESFAAKKIVVTNNTARNRWILEEAGIYCNTSDINEYVNALKQAIDIKDKKETIIAIEKALKKFEWQNILFKYNQVFNEILKL